MHTPEPMTGTILLIDHGDRLPRQQAILEQAGFTVLTATTAEGGLKLAAEQKPDLVLAEVMLEKPDSGFVLGYKMKTDPALAVVPLVLLSSVFQRSGMIFDLNSPQARQWIKADAYIERPVEPELFDCPTAHPTHAPGFVRCSCSCGRHAATSVGYCPCR